jgi:predicted permease
MFILGINLSMALQMKPSTARSFVSGKTIAAIVVAKMIIMPCIGILSAIILKNYVWNIPDGTKSLSKLCLHSHYLSFSPIGLTTQGIDGPFYLSLMIVTITPTANTVMVMVELGDGDAKEGMTRIIGWQYAVAPILLSCSVMCVVQVAGLW